MTILRTYQASTLLPDKIVDPEKVKDFSLDEETLLKEKIEEAIEDLDNDYMSDDEGGEKAKSFKKRQKSIYKLSNFLYYYLTILTIGYVLLHIIFFPFFFQNYSLLSDSDGDGISAIFPKYQPNEVSTYVGYFDRKLIYSYNKDTGLIETNKASDNFYYTWKTFLRDPGMNIILKILYFITLGISVVTALINISNRRKPKLGALIVETVLYLISLVIHFMLLSKPTGDRLIIQVTLSIVDLLILIPILYIAHKVHVSSRRFGYYIRYPITDLISRTFSIDMNEEEKVKESSKQNILEETDKEGENDTKEVVTKKKDKKEILESIIKDIDNSLEIQAARKQMKKRVDKGHNLFSLIVIVLVIILFANFLIEFIKIMNSQGEFFPETVSGGMTAERNRVQRELKPQLDQLIQQKNRVEIVLLDGLRYDKFMEHPKFQEILADNNIMKDAQYTEITCSLPSMSLPNWLTIMTGAPPEVHGLLNNILAPETGFDSMFGRVMFENNTFCGITGSTTFPALVKSQLSPLVGDGGVAPSFGPLGSSTNAYYADIERLKITKQAMTGSINFDLFLSHFSDIDIQGHAFGVDKKYNKDDTYYRACGEKADIFREILNTADENTVVIMISDHGQVDAGGHGGTSEQNMNVPIMAYKKNSNFGSFKGTDFFPKETWNNLDVAATVTALLGLPAPAQTEGRMLTSWIQGLVNSSNNEQFLKITLRDLLLQKQVYVINLFKTMGMGPSSFPDVLKRNPMNDGDNYTSEMYAKEIQEIISIYKDVRHNYIRTHIIRNAILDLLFVILAFSFQLWIMERYTFTFPINVFSPLSNTIKDEEWSDQLKGVVKKNRVAAIATGFAVILQFVLSIFVFFLIYIIKGYGIPDSTVLHHPKVIPEFLIALLSVSVILQLIFGRLFVLVFAVWNPNKKVHLQNKTLWQKIKIYFKMLYSNYKLEYSDVQMVYLMKEYAFLWTTFIICICLLLSAAYTFIIPNTFNIPFVIPDIWTLKFRVLAFQCISIPIIIGHLIGLLFWPPESQTQEDIHFFDGIYKMGALKFMYSNHKNQESQKIYPLSKSNSKRREMALLSKSSNGSSTEQLNKPLDEDELNGNVNGEAEAATTTTGNGQSPPKKRMISKLKSTYSLLIDSEDYSKYFGDFYNVFNQNYNQYFKVRNLVDVILRRKRADNETEKKNKGKKYSKQD